MPDVSIYEIITIISCITTFGVVVYTFRQTPSKGMTYFLISMFSIFFTCLMSLLEITAKTSEAIIIAVKVGYVGRILCVISLPKFLLEYCHLKVSKWITYLMILINVGFVTLVFTTDKNGLFYQSFSVHQSGSIYFLQIKPGIFYYPMLLELYLVMMVMFFIIMIRRHDKKDREIRKKYLLLAICDACPCVGLLLYVLFLSGGFDLMPVSLAVSSCIYFFAMRKHFLFDITQNGKDYVLDNANEAVIVTDEYHAILYLNQAGKELTDGLKTGQDLSATGFSFLCEDNIKFERNEFYYESYYSSLTRKDGTVEGYLIEARDHTEIHNTMIETKRLRIEAQKANQAKSDFLANMSHEIRTPINAILGMNEMILRENIHPNIREYSLSIQKAGNALLSLINDILNFSKLESGKMEYNIGEYDSKEILISLKKMIETGYPGKKIQFHVSINKNFPKRLYGDVNRITQLIMNAITNSAEMMVSEEVDVRFDFIAKAVDYDGLKILEDISKNNKKYPEIWLQMKIDDNNKVISREAFDVLVDLLQDQEENYRAKYEREELKSAIISRLIQSMNAKLYMNLEDDGTVSTTLSIPQGVVDETPIGDVRDDEDLKHDYSNKLFETTNADVLVVDDNAINLKVVQALLRRTKINVDLSNSGMDCIEKCKKKKYDIIFMDHLMPGLSGIETLHLLREKSEDNASTPVIVLTANSVEGYREMYEREGFAESLMKPIASEILEDCILKYLDPSKVIFK